MIPIARDHNYGPSAYARYADVGCLLVSNMFFTFQGEGPYGGTPAIFLRLAGCNLGTKSVCPWCDAEFAFSRGLPKSADEIARFIREHGHRNKMELVVVSGGEPLLQWRALPEVMRKVNTILDADLTWQFETNGVMLEEEMFEEQWDLDLFFVVSPKVMSERGYRPLPPFLAKHADKLALKYVVSAEPSSPYHNLPPPEALEDFEVYVSGQTEYGPDDPLTSPGAPVNLLLMSQYAREQTARNYAHAAMLALKHGYKVSYQTHLLGGVE